MVTEIRLITTKCRICGKSLPVQRMLLLIHDSGPILFGLGCKPWLGQHGLHCLGKLVFSQRLVTEVESEPNSLRFFAIGVLVADHRDKHLRTNIGWKSSLMLFMPEVSRGTLETFVTRNLSKFPCKVRTLGRFKISICFVSHEILSTRRKN